MSTTDKNEKWLHRHIQLLLSGDKETVCDELLQMAYIVSARRVMTEDQARQVSSMAHEIVRTKMKQLIDIAADALAKDEHGGKH